LREVDLVLGSSDILSEREKGFFQSMERLCDANIATGNPIMFRLKTLCHGFSRIFADKSQQVNRAASVFLRHAGIRLVPSHSSV
jgi:hypothetical protein